MNGLAGDGWAQRNGFLRGLAVLELGDGLAGAAATATLSDFGADVTTSVDSRSPHRRARPALDPSDGSSPSLLSLLLDRGKRSVACPTSLDDLEGLVRRGPGESDGSTGFDLVVVDRVAGAPCSQAELADPARYASWAESVNPAAWVTISAFGLSGPRAPDFATELTMDAASSLLSLVCDPATGDPLKLAGNQALLNTAQACALAACHAIDLARDGGPVHLDLSALESNIAMGPVLALAHLLLNSGELAGAKRYGAPASFYRCADGLVRISAMESHQWQGVVKAMGSPAWADRFEETASRVEFASEIDVRIAAWTKDLTKSEAETTLQKQGVPATAMYAPAEILDSPQLAHRGTLETSELDDDVRVRSIGRPFRDSPCPAPTDGTPRRRSLRGLKVIEAGHVLAVPLAGALLGALGARVTKLEDVDRIDMYRRRGPYIDGAQGINRAAYFAIVNHSKESLAVDPGDAGDRCRLEELLESADVVVENLGARRLTRLGLCDATTQGRPGLLAVSSSGFGGDGPYANYRAYAYNLQTSCALGYLTRNEAGEQAEIDIPWADLVSGYALATIVAAWAVGPSGNEGAVVDFSMAELVTARFNEYLAAASIDAASDERVDRANAVTPYAPNGAYRTADGWMALSVDDDGFEGFCEAAGVQLAASDEQFAAEQQRLCARPELDLVLSGAFVDETSESWTKRLRGSGVAAERVASVRDLIDNPHLKSRGYFTAVTHPEWGTRRLLGIPWRRFGHGPLALSAPPLLATDLSEELADPQGT